LGGVGHVYALDAPFSVAFDGIFDGFFAYACGINGDFAGVVFGD
jgi:hypothetical protein